jgi:hypothetical protein
MEEETTQHLMTKSEFAKHRNVSKPYISKLARNGILVMCSGKIDVVATDMVLDDRPVADIDPSARRVRMAKDMGQGQPTTHAVATFSQARTIEMVFRAKLSQARLRSEGGEAHRCRGRAKQNSCRSPRFSRWAIWNPRPAIEILASEHDVRRIRSTLATEFNRELDRLADALQGVGMGTVHLGAR